MELSHPLQHSQRPHLKSGTYVTLIRILSVCGDTANLSNSITEVVRNPLELGGEQRNNLHSQSHDVEFSQPLSTVEDELEKVIQPSGKNDTVGRNSITPLNDSLNYIEVSDMQQQDCLKENELQKSKSFEVSDHDRHCSSATGESIELGGDKQNSEHVVGENEKLCSFDVDMEEEKDVLHQNAAKSMKVNSEGGQKQSVLSFTEESDTEEGESSMDEFEEGEIPFVDSFVDLICDTSETVVVQHHMDNAVIIRNPDSVFGADGDVVEIEEKKEKFDHNFSKNKTCLMGGDISENDICKIQGNRSSESCIGIVVNPLGSGISFQSSDRQLIDNERRVLRKQEGGISIMEKDDSPSRSKKETDKKIRRNPRGKISEERKEKRKIQKRKKRAENNRKLGVKRLKLPPVVTQKPVKICNNYLKGRCQKGEECRYSHDAVPLTKSKPCCHFARQACMKGEKCPFDHDLSKYPCNNFTSNGFCGRGDDCLFSHTVPEGEKGMPTVPSTGSNSRALKPDVPETSGAAASSHNNRPRVSTGGKSNPMLQAPLSSGAPSEPSSAKGTGVVAVGRTHSQYVVGPPPKGISVLSFGQDPGPNRGVTSGTQGADQIPGVGPPAGALKEGFGNPLMEMHKKKCSTQQGLLGPVHRPLMSTLMFAAEFESQIKGSGPKGVPSDGGGLKKALEIFDILYKKKVAR